MGLVIYPVSPETLGLPAGATAAGFLWARLAGALVGHQDCRVSDVEAELGGVFGYCACGEIKGANDGAPDIRTASDLISNDVEFEPVTVRSG